MSVEMKPTNVIKARLGINPNGLVQRFFTHTCRVHMDKYVPFDTGTLASTAEENTNKIIYIQPYAKVVYYGVRNGKELNYQKDKHEHAGPYWDRRMWSAEKDKVVKEVQNYFDKFGGK